jgi:catechol 2,3-dioxygenase-like lactoylglutathione lyase family enzyme
LDRAALPEAKPEESVRRPLLRGIHHLALNTDDLRGTLDFYVRVLGMPLVHGLITGPGAAQRAESRGNPPFDCIAHYFVDMGGDSLLAFFEFPKGQAGKADRNALGAMQHVSFVCGPRRFAAMQERLRRNGVPIVAGPMVVIPPSITSMYFFDPNGIRLEITADMAGSEDDLGVTRTCLMDRETMRAELSRVSDDEAWITSLLEHLREAD